MKTDRLRYEENETRQYLKTYLEHLKRMKDIKEDLDMIAYAKQDYEVKRKEFLITLQKRSKEFQVVRYLFGIHHLFEALKKK